MSAARAIQPKYGPVVMLRSVSRDGETYALAPGSLEILRARFGDIVHTRARVFISHETRADYEHVHAAVAPQVVMLLTGLSEETLSAVGGVQFRDAVTERELPRA